MTQDEIKRKFLANIEEYGADYARGYRNAQMDAESYSKTQMNALCDQDVDHKQATKWFYFDSTKHVWHECSEADYWTFYYGRVHTKRT